MATSQEEQESSVQAKKVEDDTKVKVVVKALLSAVEEQGGSSDDADADTDTDADESSPENNPNSYSCKPLLQVFQPGVHVPVLSPKQQQSLILETIQSSSFFQKSHAKRFFSGLKSILEIIISEEAYVPESAFQEEEEEANTVAAAVEEITPDEKSTECLHFIKYAAMCVQAFLEGRVLRAKTKNQAVKHKHNGMMQVQILPQVYDVAADLHNILLSLHTCGPESVATQNAVISLCESWWLANAVHRDTLIAQCLPMVVVQALDGKEFLQKSHIKKLFNLSEAFQVIDFTNPYSDSLRSLLLRVASNPLCLRMSEGKKFLASLFQDPDLVKDLHLAFKAQIPEAKKTVLQAYGEIYYRAWKDAAADDQEEDFRDTLEQQTLQDLMHSAIHVASPTTTKSILTLLEPIHADKKSPQVAGLLYRLYSPILWRSLAAANPLVRKNAITVLEQVFPLHDPNTANQVKAAVEKGTAALKAALQDVDPRVRVAGSEATSRICAMFWDALPAADIRMLLNHIVMEHSSDATSSAVRAAALEATTTLLEASQSHAVLRALLPSLGNLIHDKAERVRIAAVKMLIRIKQIPGIRFYHVVPVDHLTARLSEERRIHRSPRNPVARQLTALMLNSYFPSNVSASSQLQRTLTFLLTDPSAAYVFYANLADHLEVESLTKFIVMLLACLKSAVQVDQAQQVKNSQKRKKRRRRTSEQDHQDEEDDQSSEQPQDQNDNLSASNTPLMASLTETIGVLWESIESPLSDPLHEPCNELLVKRFAEANMVHILSHFEQKATENDSQTEQAESNRRDECQRACAAILRCAARLPRDSTAVDGVVSFISSSLHSLSSQEEAHGRPAPHMTSHLALLCLWGMTEEVASALAASIESACGDEITLMSPCFDDGRRTSRRVSARDGKQDSGKTDIPKFPPHIVWEIIDGILRGSDPSSAAVREAILSSQTACSSIESALERGTIFAERLLAADSAIGRGFKEVEVEFILCSCEAYGRFALHKEAYNQNGDLGFNSQAKMLLDWSTEKVIPALLGAQSGETELRDLDLSRISNVSDSLIMPGSPSPMSPPKQKANLGRTPDRLDGRSSSVFDMDQALNHDPAIFLVSSVARSLLQSSCVIFAELLAVGGSSCGYEIERSAVGWCQIFDTAEESETDDDDDEQEMHFQTELLPSFIRLAIQLCKSATNNFALLKELFVKCSELGMGDAMDVMKKAVSSLLNARSTGEGSKLTDYVIDTFLNAADELLASTDNMESTSSFESVSTVGEVWSHSKGCLATVLEAIVSNQNAKLSLARKLVSRLLLGASCGGNLNTKTSFEVRCLSLLLKSTAGCSAAMARIVNELDMERFEEDGEMRGVVHRLLESV